VLRILQCRSNIHIAPTVEGQIWGARIYERLGMMEEQ